MTSLDTTNASPTHWVFGYGSLIWNPGFAFVGAQPGLLRGAHRSLSIYSHYHRGTAELPGLVFGLTHGGSCRGMAFEVTDGDWEAVHAYLVAREQVTTVYREAMRPVRLEDGRVVTALVYVVDERHEQYAGELDLDRQLEMVRQGVGISGPNVDYVLNTAQHLAELGIKDRQLMALAERLAADRVRAA